MHALTSAEPSERIASFAGGKGGNLHRLTALGFDVPDWAIVGGDACHAFVEGANLADELAALLAATTAETASQTAATAAALIGTAPIVPDVLAVIEAAYRQAGSGPVAVRSSGMAEDGACFSFAGQFSSYLNVTGIDQVIARVRCCWASAYSERSLHYRLVRGIPLRTDGLAVIVQAMVDPSTSGVLFTANPISGRRGECVVSAVRGLADGLVSGAVDGDTVVLDGATGQTREQGCHADEASTELAVTTSQLDQLRRAGVGIAEAFGAEQDVEWAFADDRLWILQSRPITTPLTDPPGDVEPTGQLRIWDNSNIIESFSGICSPLTFTAAADAYGRVYRSYARSLRVPRAQLRQMDDWLPVMLGYFHGRVYYNLLHWYRMVRLAPAYRLNRKVLEASIGVEEPLDDTLAQSLHPFEFSSKLRGKLARAVSTAAFAWRFARIDRLTDRFIERFYVAYRSYDDVDYEALPGDEVYRRFQRMEHDLIERWGPMMVLDAILLTCIGALHLLTNKWLPDAPEWFTLAAAGPGEDVESAEPARALSAMAVTVRQDAELTRIVTETPPERTYDAIRAAGHSRLLSQIKDYLTRYGYRSVDELKLEVPDLREDPSSLFLMLRNALPVNISTRRVDADAYLDAHLTGPKRLGYDRLRGKTSRSLANRERLRFCRTRAFGMAKRMLRAMGRDLSRIGAIDDFADVFHLRLEELRGCYEGTIAHAELKPLIELRKKQRDADRLRTAPARFETRGTVYWQGNLSRGGWAASGTPDAAADGTELRGTPCSPGVVSGRAAVVDQPRDVAGSVLVAYRTDPGWVAALPSASALLIERGSPLTHVAIVARELGIPTVVRIKDLTTRVANGALLRVDGNAGVVTVLAGPDAVAPTKATAAMAP
jgi:pyruvate,water dikinase